MAKYTIVLMNYIHIEYKKYCKVWLPNMLILSLYQLEAVKNQQEMKKEIVIF